MKRRSKAIIAGCGEILFLQGKGYGALLVAVTLLNPRLGLPGLAALLGAYAFAWLIGMEQPFRQAGFYIYNPFLVGLALGYRLELAYATVGLAILAGILTFLVTAVLANLVFAGGRLPVLSLPFTLVAAIVYLMFLNSGSASLLALPSESLFPADLGMPLWLAGLFRSFGAILFAPDVLTGIVLSLVILRYSPILFLLSVVGYYAGIFTRILLVGPAPHVFLDGNNFNFILTAAAVGGVFLIPTLQSGLLALIAASMASLVVEAFGVLGSRWGIPPFTLPFCLITLGVVYSLRLANYPLLSSGIGGAPEVVRENSLVNRARYPGHVRTLALPFSGVWTVWQGFNGRWTHRGIWRYAYDFVITDAEGNTHRDRGGRLQDYYCYGMPVLSPVRGYVVRVVNHLPDNLVGSVNGQSNWGNLVILYDPRGFHVEISHFAFGSIQVREGEWVERGAVLGRCGNSGYSPQPHIHIQVQATATPGDATIPFSFVSYRQGDRYYANDLPKEHDRIESLYVEKRLDEATSFILDEVQEYDVLRRGEAEGHFRLRTAVADDGTTYFESDRGRLYFGKHEGTFYFYRLDGKDPYLRLLFSALPRMPLAYREGLTWHDYVPTSVVATPLKRPLARLGAFVYPKLARIGVVQRFHNPHTIESVFESRFLARNIAARVELDRQGGFGAIHIGDLQLKKRFPVLFEESKPVFPNSSQTQERSPVVSLSTISGLATVALLVSAGSGPLGDQQCRQAIQQSCEAERAKDFSKAIAVLLPQHQAHPDHYLLNARLGWLHYLKGAYADAQPYYQAAIKAAPKSVEAKLGCTLAMLSATQYAAAEAMARQVLEIDPSSYYGNLRLAVALRWQQKYGEAREIVQQMLVRYPTDAALRGELALLDAAQSKPDSSALQSWMANSAIREALLWSQQAEAKLDYSAAIKALLESYNAHPQDYALNLRLGWLHYLIGDYHSSSKYYYAAIKIAPKATEAGLGYLLALLAEKRYQDAETLAQQIVDGDPGNYYANVRLAVAKRWLAKYGEADAVLQRLQVAYPADVVVLSELGLVRVAQKKKDEAKALFNDVLALDPGNATATEQLKGL